MTSRRNVQETLEENLEMPSTVPEPAVEHTLKGTWWPGGRSGHQPERHVTGKVWAQGQTFRELWDKAKGRVYT